MNIQINKASEASVREQLTAQIELLIATKELKSADLLPSVRALGRRLKIHHNTVSQVYGDLVRGGLLVRRRGAKVAVSALDSQDRKAASPDLDDILSDAIFLAGKAGYSLQAFRKHALDRLSAELPVRVLVVAAESLFGGLLQAELEDELDCPVVACTIEELERTPGMAATAVVVSHITLMPKLLGLFGKRQALLTVQYNDTGQVASQIAQLSRPSLISLISVSPYVLASARMVLSPVIGDRHSLVEHSLGEGTGPVIGIADMTLCDSIVYRGLSSSDRERVLIYRVVSTDTIAQIRSLMAAV